MQGNQILTNQDLTNSSQWPAWLQNYWLGKDYQQFPIEIGSSAEKNICYVDANCLYNKDLIMYTNKSINKLYDWSPAKLLNSLYPPNSNEIVYFMIVEGDKYIVATFFIIVGFCKPSSKTAASLPSIANGAGPSITVPISFIRTPTANIKLAFNTQLTNNYATYNASNLTDCFQFCVDNIGYGCAAVSFQTPSNFSSTVVVKCLLFTQSQYKTASNSKYTSIFINTGAKPAFSLASVANFKPNLLLTGAYNTTSLATIQSCYSACVSKYNKGAGCVAVSFNVNTNAGKNNCKFFASNKKNSYSISYVAGWISLILRAT
jgi:hypothetical protein